MDLPTSLQTIPPSALRRALPHWSVDVTLILSFAAVVLSFLGASWYGEHRASEIEEAALSIRENAAPSIRRLANARAELRRLQLLVHRALDEGVTSRRAVEIRTGRTLLGNEIAEYRRLPMYPSELNVWPSVATALDEENADVEAILRALRAGDMPAASASADNLGESSEHVADRLSEAIDANVAEASRLAAVIRTSRQRGTVWTLTLDSAGVMLSMLAAALALRVSRAHARAVHAYSQVAERRADELELFATRMAHDVRTPLTGAGLALDVVRRHGLGDEAGRRAVTRARGALDQTAKIIDGLLDFARAGAAPQVGARASVADVAEEIAVVMRLRADQVGADLVIHADSRASVACSEGVVASALGNLVSNALTYVDGAPIRRVTIDIRDQDGQVKTTVSDTGSGLPAGIDPASFFEPYVRGDGARGRGLGLGLATVKRIVDAHGGRVGVESSADGAHFWFVLPTVHTHGA